MFHRSEIILLFLTGFCCFASGTSRDCPECPEKWTHYNGFCYRYFFARKTWDEAHSFCDGVNTAGHVSDDAYSNVHVDLTSIHSAGEQKFLYEYWKSVRGGGENNLWIGLNDLRRRRDFAWVDATSVDYSNWASGEPNNFWGQGEHYGSFQKDGKWNDHYKHDFPFICKMKRV